MDKKTAVDILGLDINGSFEDAKKAYRKLAKKYHPDVVSKTREHDGSAEARMKDINLAFCFLSSLPRSPGAVKQTTVKKREKKMKSAAIKQDLNGIFCLLSRIPGLVAAFFLTPKHGGIASQKTEKKMPGARSKEKNLQFDEVLQRFYQGRPDRPDPGPTQARKRVFQKNMARKQRLAAGRSGRQDQMQTGSIDKIHPVKPVSPVTKI